MTTPTEPIVFLHGINNSDASWDAVRAHIDTPTTLAPLLDPHDNVDTLATQLLATLPEKFTLVGHSFGGYVALAMLAQAPQRIQALILINTHDGADNETTATSRRAKAQQAREGQYTALAAGATQASYHPANLDNKSLMAERETAVKCYGPERFAAHQEASATRPDRSQLLTDTQVPLLVITATEDAVIPPQRQKEMATRSGATYITIEQAGHMLPVEQPKLTANAITTWLNTLN